MSMKRAHTTLAVPMLASLQNQQQENLRRFGEALAHERTRRNLTRDDMARRSGATRGEIEKWEKGNGFPTAVQFKRMTHVLTKLGVYRDSMPWAPRPANEPTPHGVPLTFGDALKAARLREGLEPKDVADLVGNVSDSAVYAWERDIAIPVEGNYERLVEIFPELAGVPLTRDPLNKPTPPGKKVGDGIGAKRVLAPDPEPREAASGVHKMPVGAMSREELDALLEAISSATGPEASMVRRLLATVADRDDTIDRMQALLTEQRTLSEERGKLAEQLIQSERQAHADLKAAREALEAARSAPPASVAPVSATPDDDGPVSITIDPEQIIEWAALVGEARSASNASLFVALLETSKDLKIRPSRLLETLKLKKGNG